MDLPCPEWMQYVEQKWSAMGPAKRKSFSLLTDLDEIFRFAQSQVQQDDVESLSRLSARYPVKKSTEGAARFREQGNLRFKGKDYRSAAIFYSKGLCFAEKNTEQLSLCYANRSAALFNLGLYDKCLEDIQQAFVEGYPSHLQRKLTDRQTHCMNQLKRLEQLNVPFSRQQPSHAEERSEENACPSAGVSVCFTTAKGRHMLSSEKKPAGEMVLEDEAFTFVLIPGYGHHTSFLGTEERYCHHCLCQTLSFVPCLGCSYACYCGPRCKKEAWKQYHHWECPAGSDLLALGVLAHLALRVTLKAGLKEVQRARETCFTLANDEPKADGIKRDGNGESDLSGASSLEDSLLELSIRGLPMSSKCSKHSDHSGCYHGNSYLGIYSLLPHVDKHSSSLRFLLAFSIALLCQKLKEEGPLAETWPCSEEDQGTGCWVPEQCMLGATALRHMMQLRCNAQAVTAIRVKEDSSLAVQSSEEIRIATAVFPILSLLNHSCSPNTSISFSLGLGSAVKVSVRACKDIGAGQELFHCYGPCSSRMSVRDRQRFLQEQYFFSCNCEACEVELMNGTGKSGPTSNGLKCKKCGSSLQTSVNVHVCSQASCAHQITTEEVQRTIQMLQNQLNQAFELMENDRVDGALKVLTEAASRADSTLMRTHPVQGQLADARARAYATIGDWKQAASYLKCSLAAVGSQYGEDSVELGRQLFKLAQLHFNGGDIQSALSVIPKAQHLLSLHSDPHCEELQELKDMESCLYGVGRHGK